MARPSRVLIADLPQAHELVAACLPGKNLQFVQTVEGAKAALATLEFEAVVVGLHFDDSRMFALIEHMRARTKYRAIPIVCVRTLPTLLPPELRDCVEQALRMMGVTAYLEVRGSNQAEVCRRLKEITERSRRSAAPAPDQASDA